MGEFDSAFESRQSPHQKNDSQTDVQLGSSASRIQRNRDGDGQSESRSEKEKVKIKQIVTKYYILDEYFDDW